MASHSRPPGAPGLAPPSADFQSRMLCGVYPFVPLRTGLVWGTHKGLRRRAGDG
ncbi:MAG: hypothetical protein ABIL62_14935 [Planctomycetota bacterium]